MIQRFALHKTVDASRFLHRPFDIPGPAPAPLVRFFVPYFFIVHVKDKHFRYETPGNLSKVGRGCLVIQRVAELVQRLSRLLHSREKWISIERPISFLQN